MSEEGKRLTSGQSARTPWAADSGLGKIEQQRKAEQKGSARQAGRWLGIDCQQGKGRSECAIRPQAGTSDEGLRYGDSGCSSTRSEASS